MRKRISRKSSRIQRKSSSRRLFRPRGFIGDFFIIILAVILGLFLIGNIFPKIPGTTNPLDQYEINTTIDPTIYKNLQLKTFPFKKCLASIAISFLVDQSGSMSDYVDRNNTSSGTKLANLQSGLRYFASKFPDEGAVGLQIHYTAAAGFPPIPKYNEVLVDHDYFKNVKTSFLNAISNFNPAGATYSKDAFIVMKQRLKDLKDSNKFPANYKFALVYISDGIPETAEANFKYGQGFTICSPLDAADSAAGMRCTPYTNARTGQTTCRCYDPSQNPVSVANEIKQELGIRIFTIRYVGDADGFFDADLKNIMESVASSQQDAYVAPVGEQLNTIIDQIANKACSSLDPRG